MKKIIKQHTKELISNYLFSNYFYLNNKKEDQKSQWFNGVLKNYFFKEYNHLLSNITIDTLNINHISSSHEIIDFDKKIRHIIDYLTSQDAPKNFFSMTFEEAEKQTTIWDNWLQQRSKKGDDPLNVILNFELNDGWKVFELTSKQALVYEGGTMQHCVASYIDRVLSGNVSIYSIRDRNLNSHITLEYNKKRKEIVQIQGKQNNKPIEKYIPYLINFLEKSNLELSPALYKNYNFIKFNHRIYYNITKEDFYEVLFDFFEKNQGKNINGGTLILSDINKNLNVHGKWEKILIENSKFLNLDNIESNNIFIQNSQLNSFNNIKSLELIINKSNFKSFKNVFSSTIQSRFSNFSLLDISNSKIVKINNHLLSLQLKNDNNSLLDVFELSDTYVYGLNKVNSLTVDLSDFKSLDNKTIQFDNLVNLKIDKFPFDHLDPLTIKQQMKNINIKTGDNILSISDLDIPELNVSINSCTNLQSIDSLNVNSIHIENLNNFNSLIKNKINRLFIFFNRNNNNGIEKIARNRIKHIKTNKIDIFKPKKNKNKPI